MVGVNTEDRRTFIGGSDAPVILGVSTWKKPFELWQEKVGIKEPDDLSDNDRVHFGNVLEDIVAGEFATRRGLKVRRVNDRLVSKVHPFAVAQIDRRIVGGGILECKTAGAEMKDHWGDEGTNQIPIPYWTQVQHQMMVTGEEFAYVAVLIGGNTFKTYLVKRDEEFIENMVLAEKAFYANMITRTPPAPVSYEEASSIWKRAPALPVFGDERFVMLAARYAEVNAQIGILKEEADQIKLEFTNALQDKGDTLIVDGKTVATWKASNTVDEDKVRVEQPEVFAACSSAKLSVTKLRKEYPSIAKQYEIPSDSRTLLIKKV